MTQVSLFGGEFPDLDVDLNQSDSEPDADELDRKEEIKRGLEAFGEEESFDIGTDFDDDDDDDDNDSSKVESRGNSVNQSKNDTGNSILSNTGKDTSFSKHSTMNGYGTLLQNGGVNGNSSIHSSLGSVSPFANNNGLNLNMLPNSVMVENSQENRVLLSSGKTNGNGIGSGNHSYLQTPVTNGHGSFTRINGNLMNGNGSILKNSVARPKKQVTIVEHSETIGEQEEILASNPTISMYHKEHCPRLEKEGYVNEDMWMAAERSDEQMKTMLQIRERQIQQGEQEIAKLQKDKRALNHQIGLMKTEMVQMRSKQNEFDTYKKVMEQEVEFMQNKMRDTIIEFEKAKENEIAATDRIKFLNDEIEKYKQEVQLLSSIGSSVQQVEINDVVRQLREKHANELVSWKKQVLELQGQLRTYKRQQQTLPEESSEKPVVETNETGCQTDAVRVQSPSKNSYPGGSGNGGFGAGDYEIGRRKEMSKIAIINTPNQDDLLIKEKKIISLNEKFEELKREFQEERDQKQLEIQEYRERLARLPAELYKRWEETQRILGLQAVLDSKPICVDAYTSPMEPDEIDLEENEPEPIVKPDTQDAEVQVDLCPVNLSPVPVPEPTSSTPSLSPQNQETQVHAMTSFSPHLNSTKNASSVLIQTDLETSTEEVNTQTDETLQTFNELGILINSWHRELLEAKENEEDLRGRCQEYEGKCQEFQVALSKYHKQFKVLQKVATKCRKESKKREDIYKKEIADLKQHQREVLQKLNEKLDILA